MRRWTIRLIAFTGVAVVTYFAVTFAVIWLGSRHDEARPDRAQAIVVLGAAQYNGKPSRVLRSRLDHAVALYRKKYADLIVVTGGRQPGDRYTEATASANYLGARGVPDSAILREVRGRTSWQSMAAAAAFLKERGVRRVILVSDAFHSTRIALIAHELGLDGYASPTRTSPIRGMATVPYLARETVAVGLGRIVGFRRAAGIDQRVGHFRSPAPSG